MGKGNWFLLYRYETGTNTPNHSQGQGRAKLQAKDAEGAEAEAREVWATMVAVGAHPPHDKDLRVYFTFPVLIYALNLNDQLGLQHHDSIIAV